RRRHTRLQGDWSSDVCSSDLRKMPIATVKQLCTPSAVVKSDSLVEQVAQIEDFASGKVDGRAFFQRNYFTQGLELLVRRGFERQIGRASCRERVWVWGIAGSV